jgi:hypothetical protein
MKQPKLGTEKKLGVEGVGKGTLPYDGVRNRKNDGL